MKEISAGAVLFNKGLFLLLDYGKHWGFPKGNIETGEQEKDTVKREIQEETGITQIGFIPGFREEINYYYTVNNETISKKVIFYLAKTDQQKITLSHEHVGYKWLPYEEAMQQITFQDEKDILKKAKPFS
ncbi:MAG: NUDIX domain-containing protein [Nanoarchaeota archaeon]|nr:NUDIX domain-containing protein [Nanoarchaeota archaeon]MBU1703818.1 NUDIX domain-containing protein [Nanoarchaeota archaeon]